MRLHFRSRIWLPIAIILAVINVASILPAALAAQPIHATSHGLLAILCGWWAVRLYRRRMSERGDGLMGTTADPHGGGTAVR